jgi:siroheme synthase
VTAHEGAADGPVVDWPALARIDTLVVFMAGSAAASVAARLLIAGRAPATPAALIVDASLPGQWVWTSDLATLAQHPPTVPAHRPCLLVIGDVVALGAELAWTSSFLPQVQAATAPGVAASPAEPTSGSVRRRRPSMEVPRQPGR